MYSDSNQPLGQLLTESPLRPDIASAFVSFVLSDEAQWPSRRGWRQTLPLRGRSISYGVKVYRRRGSDRSERIYVAITALQKADWGNYEACCELVVRWGSKFGKSRRGRRRANIRTRYEADKVETIRSIYNSFKPRHPWKEQLPDRDLVYEQWCKRFQLFAHWGVGEIMSAIERGLSGKEFADELRNRRGEGGKNNYEALVALGEDGLSACLRSWGSEPLERALSRSQLTKFVKEFFGAVGC